MRCNGRCNIIIGIAPPVLGASLALYSAPVPAQILSLDPPLSQSRFDNANTRRADALGFSGMDAIDTSIFRYSKILDYAYSLSPVPDTLHLSFASPQPGADIDLISIPQLNASIAQTSELMTARFAVHSLHIPEQGVFARDAGSALWIADSIPPSISGLSSDTYSDGLTYLSGSSILSVGDAFNSSPASNIKNLLAQAPMGSPEPGPLAILLALTMMPLVRCLRRLSSSAR